MSIVNHTLSQIVQPNGRISYTLMMFDQDGNSWESVGELPAATDVDAFVAARIAARNDQLAFEEAEAIINGG
jgi:hypothetical protein